MTTGIIIILTAVVTLILKEIYEYYKEQQHAKKMWEKQELLATIDNRIELKLKEIIKE